MEITLLVIGFMLGAISFYKRDKKIRYRIVEKRDGFGVKFCPQYKKGLFWKPIFDERVFPWYSNKDTAIKELQELKEYFDKKSKPKCETIEEVEL